MVPLLLRFLFFLLSGSKCDFTFTYTSRNETNDDLFSSSLTSDLDFGTRELAEHNYKSATMADFY